MQCLEVTMVKVSQQLKKKKKSPQKFLFPQVCSYYTQEPKIPKLPLRSTWPLQPFWNLGLTKDNAVKNNLRASLTHAGY